MKSSLLVILYCIISISTIAQSGFDKSLLTISQDISNKLAIKGKKKVVVLYITDINKAPSVTGKYLANIISGNIVNNPGDFMVFDRENLNSIKEANQLIEEGYVSVDQAKEIGRLLSVDVIIIGNYTVLSTTIKVALKALDSSTGFIIAASTEDLPIDGDAASLLGISPTNSSPGNNSNNSNRGFNNRPLNSNEAYNNPETVNKECEIKNTGDYCFENATNKTVRVSLTEGGQEFIGNDLILSPGQTLCFYNLKSKNYEYRIFQGRPQSNGMPYYYDPAYISSKGVILVEKCKSKTYVIKS